MEFTILYNRPMRVLCTVLGIGPRRSGISTSPDSVTVRMGWAFRADLARSAITNVEPTGLPRLSIGVHGFRGRYLVNGSTRNLVKITVDGATCRVIGLTRPLGELCVSVEDPDGLVQALRNPVTM